jgi:hypothetical protein
VNRFAQEGVDAARSAAKALRAARDAVTRSP